MFRSDGRRLLSMPERAVLKAMRLARERLNVHVDLDDAGRRVRYVCETAMDALRPVSLWIKEEGTMHWIDSQLRADDVFLDIGANIGIYTIAAAVRLGPQGKVYAFEPHKVNALSLLRNIDANRLAQRVDVFSVALSDREALLDFNYVSLSSASTASQLGHRNVPGEAREFVPVASEKVFATTVDHLVSGGTIRPPNLVKIDVDGNEIAILRGMSALLRGTDRPRSIQVELNVGEQEQIIALMAEHDYRLATRHLTYAGKAAQAAGKPLEAIAHNAVFEPVG